MDSFEVMAEILGLRKVYFLVDSDLIENLKRFERTDNPEALSLFTVIWTAGMARYDVSSNFAHGSSL